MIRAPLAGLLSVILVGSAAAQQVLYDPLPPRGSAYVRFINGLPEAVTLRPDYAPPATLGTAQADRVGAYTVVPNVEGRTLTIPFLAGTRRAEATLRLEPGSFTTVMLMPSGATAAANAPQAVAVTDETAFNQVRAKLAFYNAAPACAAARLEVEPAGPAVFQDVAPGTVRMRAVNPVAVSVGAGCAGSAAPPFPLEGLEAGGRYSIVLMAPEGSPLAFLARDRTIPWRP